MKPHGLNNFDSYVLVGGTDRMQQVIELCKKPAVIIATIGCLMTHLSQTKGFSIDKLEYFIMD